MHVPGIPQDPARSTHGFLSPICGVLHRTYGGWGGDYSVGKNNPKGTGFHFLIGKHEGQVVQFADTTLCCWHAPGANHSAVGIEFTGTNAEPLTDWQVRLGAWIISAVSDAHGIDKHTFYNGPTRRPANSGWTTHAAVLGSDHSDTISDADWARMYAHFGPAIRPGTPDEISERDIRRVVAAGLYDSLIRQPNLDGNSSGIRVMFIRKVINFLGGLSDVTLNEQSGDYNDDVYGPVRRFQENVNRMIPGAITTDSPGTVEPQTRFYMALALANIRDTP